MGNECCKRESETQADKSKFLEVKKVQRSVLTGEFIDDIEDNDPRLSEVTSETFNKLYCVGKGGFSKVWKVEHNKTKEIYAMKKISKKKIYIKKSLSSLINELDILKSIKFPLIVNLDYSFHDLNYAYLIMSFAECGDLRRILNDQKIITEKETKFVIACLLLSLEYIHQLSIVHRDIKPENLILDKKGFWNLTDFGISKYWSPNNKGDTSGTPGYIAPEIILKVGYGIGADLFSVGVLAYECLIGKRPYRYGEKGNMTEYMLNHQAKVKFEEKRYFNISNEAESFINACLERKPSDRLGNNFPGEAKSHPWFNDINWDSLVSKTGLSPFLNYCLQENNNYMYYHNKYNKPSKNNSEEENLNRAYFNNSFDIYGEVYNINVHTIYTSKNTKEKISKQNDNSLNSSFEDNLKDNNIINVSIDNIKMDAKNSKPLLKKHYEKYSRSHQKSVLLKNKYDELIEKQLDKVFKNFYFNRYHDIHLQQVREKAEKQNISMLEQNSSLKNKTTTINTNLLTSINMKSNLHNYSTNITFLKQETCNKGCNILGKSVVENEIVQMPGKASHLVQFDIPPNFHNKLSLINPINYFKKQEYPNSHLVSNINKYNDY